MDDATAAPRAVAGIRTVAMPTRWSLWSERPLFVAYLLGAEATVVALTGVSAATVPTRPHDMLMLGILASLGVLQAELGRQVERTRRVIDNTPHINLSSVWTFAGVLILPLPLTAVLVAVLYGHLGWRSWQRLSKAPPHRTVGNAACVTLTCFTTYRALTWTGVDDIHGALSQGWASLDDLLAAIVVYLVFGAIFNLPGLKPAELTFKQLLGGWVDNLLEVTTLCAGALVALLLASPLPFLVVAVVLLMFFVHRSVLVTQLEVLAQTDEKTGLFNARGWYQVATETLSRAERERGRGAVLMVDVDWFKQINDTFGHQTGDVVLVAIADAIKMSVREYDAVGRFGGEEFVILLPGATTDQALGVAERIRRTVSTSVVLPAKTLAGRKTKIHSLSVSIGVAPYPDIALTADKLIGAADTALNTAKQLGRNRVRLASAA
jgi:diguanylate cyclase (GGDEF)-like protein